MFQKFLDRCRIPLLTFGDEESMFEFRCGIAPCIMLGIHLHEPEGIPGVSVGLWFDFLYFQFDFYS